MTTVSRLQEIVGRNRLLTQLENLVPLVRNCQVGSCLDTLQGDQGTGEISLSGSWTAVLRVAERLLQLNRDRQKPPCLLGAILSCDRA